MSRDFGKKQRRRSPEICKSKNGYWPSFSEILGLQSRALGDSSEHLRSDILAVVKREDDIGPAWPGESLVRPGLSHKRPTNPVQRGKDARGPGRRPYAHATTIEMD